MFNKYKESGLPNYIGEEDVVQEVFLRLWNLLENKYNPEVGPLDNFIRGHLNYCILGAFSTIKWGATGKKGNSRPQRQEMDRLMCSIEGLNVTTDPNEYDRLDMQSVYDGIMARLRGTAVDIFNLLVFEEKSQKQIAQILGITEGAITLQIQKNIRPIVREILRRYEYMD